MPTIGIDPGLSGAVAVRDDASALLALDDTPVLTLRVSRGTKQEYALPGMVRLLQPYMGKGAHARLEESQAMPGQGTRNATGKNILDSQGKVPIPGC